MPWFISRTIPPIGLFMRGGGLKRDEALRSEIFKWTVAFREEVGDDTVVEPSAFSTSFTNFARIQLK